ncbi:hypothetical protein Tco_1240254 [Tanacetum coccineum]
MTTLQFVDTHNLVVFLSKPTESEGFEQIVDFLNANPIRYALTINPTIYTSCIEQFWATTKVKTVNKESSSFQNHFLKYGEDLGEYVGKFLMYPDLYSVFEKQLEEAEVTDDGRIDDIDANEDIYLVNVHRDEDMFGVNDLVDDEVLTKPEVDEKSNVVEEPSKSITKTPTLTTTTVATTVTDPSTRPKAKGLVIHEEEQATTPTVSFQQPSQVKVQDKGKGIMVEEPEKPMSKKEIIRLDEEIALKLQAEFDEEVKLTREKAEKEEEANIVSWDNVQAMIDADYQMAQQMQAEEQEKLSIKEKSKLFVQLLEARKKNFAKLFDKAMKRVNTFVDMDTELVEGSEVRAEAELVQESSSKRVGEALEQESSKKHKVEEDKESKELKQCLEINPDDGDNVTIDATPLSTKSLTIIDYKIYKEGKKSYFQIIRANGNSQMYLTFGKMLKNLNREDLEVLWSIVKARFKKTEPVNYMDNFLLLNLKTMFEHHVKDSVWKNQQGLVKVLNWKLYDSYGVHCVTMQSILYYMLVEKMYPLTNYTLHQMFNDVKLQVDYECEMAFGLLRLVKKQLRKAMYLNEVFGSILLVINEAFNKET